MITKLDLYGRNFNYMKSLTNFKSPRNQYVRIDPARMVSEVEQGKADLAVAFAPEVARYVKESGGKVKMVVIPDDNTRVDGEKVPFHFNQSMGVRKGDEKLLEELDAAIAKAEPRDPRHPRGGRHSAAQANAFERDAEILRPVIAGQSTSNIWKREEQREHDEAGDQRRGGGGDAVARPSARHGGTDLPAHHHR